MGFLTDTHCHLNLTIFQDDLPQFLAKAWEQDISRILIPGIDLETSRKAVELADRYETLYAAVGVHPGDASSWTPGTLEELRALAQHPKTVAVGEIGLDYYRDHSPRDLQRDVLLAQLDLAADLSLPVVLHNRESFDDLWKILTGWQQQLAHSSLPLARRPGVLHSFDGTLSEAMQAVKAGFFIGISGPVTFKNALDRHEMAAGLPLDHILVETDAPYLTPQPHRGQWPNEPAYVAIVVEKIAALRQQPVEMITRKTWDNAAYLFHWE